MKFSKTTIYALQIVKMLANDTNKLFSAQELFEELNIPFRYLRKQLIELSSKGLLLSVQGKNGGYRINKPLEDVSLWDIIHMTGDLPNENQCFFGFHECPLTDQCVMHNKYNEVQKLNIKLLRETTLQDFKSDF